MKILSWNVAGIRAVLKKNALDFSIQEDYDTLCFQETKAEEQQVKLDDKFKEKYPHQLWNSSKTKKGYAGTAIWSKYEFKKHETQEFDIEGRITVVEFNKFILLTVYTPNSKGDLSRLSERTDVWDIQFKEYCNQLKKQKPLILCGDFNVIHMDRDIHQPEKHQGNIYAGYTYQERQRFTELMSCGYTDAFRMFNDEAGHYTWWSYMHNARKKDIGWRLDYFLVDDALKPFINDSKILKEKMGSDHCPITLEINVI